MKTIATCLLLMSLAATGCSQQQQNDAEKSLQQGATKVEQGLEKGAKAIGTGLDTGKVKSALMASEKIDASNIDVDKQGNTFYLRGSVPTAEQKQMAAGLVNSLIGKDEAMVDQLQVGNTTTTATPVSQETTETTTTRVESTRSPAP